MNKQINYYDWVPFFNAICTEIDALQGLDNRDELLFEKAVQTFEAGNPILRFPYIDPFSYLYALAQRNTTKQSDVYFERARQAFNIDLPIPTDLIFPTPQPNSLSLFYDQGSYVDKAGTVVGSDAIWKLFSVIRRQEEIDATVFNNVLNLKNVAVVKLTQVIFLVDPQHYIPLDTRMNSLPVPDLVNLKATVAKISTEGVSAYRSAIDLLHKQFPGCKMYEINLLNWLINTTEADKLVLEPKFCQVSSNADGQESDDFFTDFVEENAVWTGGPASKTGHRSYPLADFDRGDIVLVRRGTVRLGGIGVVLNNKYIDGGWHEDKHIQILWLVKQDRNIKDTRLGQWVGFDEASEKTLACFRSVYPETFQIIDLIRQKQGKIMNHRLNKQKNIILTGPPGTGKTRKALQIAQWLTGSEAATVGLLQAIDEQLIPDTDPNIEQIPEVELIQFHPSYSYEDFIRGIVTVTENEKLSYRVENRVLAKMAAEASKPENSDKAYILIIDEINRANLSSVLGELIYALEYRGKIVETVYAYNGDNGLMLPENLYIIGTMNTADRSIGHIDYAIRRRFAFVPVPPDPAAISSVFARQWYNDVQSIFDAYTSQEFDPGDVRIGHSYFLGHDQGMKLRWRYEIKPILLEYLRDGILLPAAETSINSLDV
ncbi:McrB family protein [Mucilaginibacter angelicae]|uniref:McrB family protein n=1 Tax=Mucilaginibacter angelicae TaxID=869718 RepID=A0ABV6L5D0_9SPHI